MDLILGYRPAPVFYIYLTIMLFITSAGISTKKSVPTLEFNVSCRCRSRACMPIQFYGFFLLTIPLIGMYRTFQFFVLALKIDLFFEFMVSVFYCIQFGLRSGITGETGIQLVVTILLVPMLYFSRMAVSIFNVVNPTFFLCTN